MFDLIDDLSQEHWEDKGSPPDDLNSIREYMISSIGGKLCNVSFSTNRTSNGHPMAVPRRLSKYVEKCENQLSRT